LGQRIWTEIFNLGEICFSTSKTLAIIHLSLPFTTPINGYSLGIGEENGIRTTLVSDELIRRGERLLERRRKQESATVTGGARSRRPYL
jgi:hypothetical protein